MILKTRCLRAINSGCETSQDYPLSYSNESYQQEIDVWSEAKGANTFMNQSISPKRGRKKKQSQGPSSSPHLITVYKKE